MAETIWLISECRYTWAKACSEFISLYPFWIPGLLTKSFSYPSLTNTYAERERGESYMDGSIVVKKKITYGTKQYLGEIFIFFSSFLTDLPRNPGLVTLSTWKKRSRSSSSSKTSLSAPSRQTLFKPFSRYAFCFFAWLLFSHASTDLGMMWTMQQY